jgi:hypothetical protein
LVLGQADSPDGQPSLAMQDGPGASPDPAAPLDDGFWYQGRLTDAGGSPVANASLLVTFRLYPDQSTATPLDETTISLETDEDGLFNEELDFNNPTLFNGEALYLGLQVEGEASEMAPRQYLRPVPYALGLRPDAVIRGSITLGDTGNAGYLYIHDTDDREVFRLSGSSGYLTLGGEGEDGDLVITNQGPTTTFQVDGFYGSFYVYDGEGETAEHRLFEFDSTYVPGEQNSQGALWGDQSNNLGNLTLMSNDDVDLYLEQTNPGSTVGEFRIYDGSGAKVYSIGADGDTWSAGLKSAQVDTEDYGPRRLYAVESPGVWFEDFGSARLVAGQAKVNIDPLFLQTINSRVPYHVFVTPLGDCNGLFVTDKTATSFEVRELGGGRATVAFDYRIVAKRLGYEDLRLASPDSTAAEVPGPGGRPNATVPELEPEPTEAGP